MGDVRDPDEFFDLAEKIVQNLNAVFQRDNSLDEFDIVPVESQSNRSPVININHKLALESWCVPLLYSHSFKCFSELLPNRNYSRRTSSSSGGNSRSSSFRSHHNGRQNGSIQLTEEDRTERKIGLSRVLVLLNPDLTLAWNFRREAFSQRLIKFLPEMHLVSLVASRKPKCSEIFAYRRWLLNTLRNENLSTDCLQQLISREFELASKAAASYFSNYHAWDYRRWLLETFIQGPLSPEELKVKFLKSEKVASDKWIESHISDHSGFHYRQRLLLQLSRSECNLKDILQLLKKELENNVSLMTLYPGHETLWYHRRFLLQLVVSKLQGRLAGNHVNGQKDQSHHIPMETNCDYDAWNQGGCEQELHYLKIKEQDLVTSILTLSSSIEDTSSTVNFITKDSSNLTILYSQRHAKWLFMMFEWDVPVIKS